MRAEPVVRRAGASSSRALPFEAGRGWAAADWRELFDEHVAIAMIDGEQPEAEARRLAWGACVERWLAMPPRSSRVEAAASLRALVQDKAGAAPTPRDRGMETHR